MATMVRWTPFGEIALMERNMRRLLEGMGLAPVPLPAADVYETKDEFVVQLEVPGFEEQELQVEVHDHLLTVKGERVAEKAEEERTFRLHERLAREFVRRFELPPEADTTKVKATFAAGVLDLHVAKAGVPVSTKIPIGQP
jgi:HSP20 family protein